jgi:hypothetical protein
MKTTKYLELQNHKAVQMYQVKYWIQTPGKTALYDIKAERQNSKLTSPNLKNLPMPRLWQEHQTLKLLLIQIQ